ncbi:EcsC family protein [Geomobilimonas luticola]|uniref:EcsC family protein n=1 Tax=Geomobilimonas luticola TaxID=1114878 RepID=A0ABS5SEM2_9BACT|nr:EcsC family protein [Geomobilimonas luticola]MBT0652452.1 EcsC family protein [Geomobilimonas luticola]
MALSSTELRDLQTAKSILENPGLVAKVSNFVGSPIEAGLKKLPGSWNATINTAARKSIEKALDIALVTMDHDDREPPSNWWHKIAAGATGATGGLFGLPALAIELPISTTIMLRSIADIARSEGEDLRHPDGRLQCLQVLALGGKSPADDVTEAGYFAARTALARAVSDAAEHLAKKGLSQKGAPAIVRLITQVAARFSIVVSEKTAVQAVPVVGAFGGAAINMLFIDHFQDMGRGHFIIRRLERLHGQEEVRRLYDTL